LKGYKIQIEKNIERVQIKQQDINKQKSKKRILQWHLIYDELQSKMILELSQ
jgi:hypothetical protein